jgi:hypothetical protein
MIPPDTVRHGGEPWRSCDAIRLPISHAFEGVPRGEWRLVRAHHPLRGARTLVAERTPIGYSVLLR